MKRLYLAIGLVVISIAIGLFEIYTVNTSSDECINSLNSIEKHIENNNIDKAIEICNKSAKNYKNVSNDVMFCYYVHDELDSVSDNLYMMREYLKYDNFGDYFALSAKTKKQLQSIKEKELIKIQNIL